MNMLFVILATLLMPINGGGNAFANKAVHVKNGMTNKLYKTLSPAQVVIPESGISIILPNEPPLTSVKSADQIKSNKKQYASLPSTSKPTLIIVDSKQQKPDSPILNITSSPQTDSSAEATSQSHSPSETQTPDSKPTAVFVPIEVPVAAPAPTTEVATTAQSIPPAPVPTIESTTVAQPIRTTAAQEAIIPATAPTVETTTTRQPTTIVPVPNVELTTTNTEPTVTDVDGTMDEASVDSLNADKEQVDDGCKTVGETVAKQSNLAVLAAAIDSAKLGEFVSDPSAIFTVFAPADEAFQKVAALLGMTIEKLISNPALPSIVGYHIVPGVAAYSSDLESDQKLSTSIKQDVSIGIPPSGEILINGFEASNTATVITPDIQACKAVVHIIDTVLIPDESVDENQLDVQPVEEAALTLTEN